MIKTIAAIALILVWMTFGQSPDRKPQAKVYAIKVGCSENQSFLIRIWDDSQHPARYAFSADGVTWQDGFRFFSDFHPAKERFGLHFMDALEPKEDLVQ